MSRVIVDTACLVPSEEQLVGSWTLSVLQADTYLASETAQEIIDPDEEGAGQITLAEDLRMELSYLRRALPTLESALPFYASAVPLDELGSSPPSGEAVRLRILPGDPLRADLFVGEELRYSAEGGEGITLDPASNTVSFESVTLSATDGAVVVADGSLQAATQPLPAGEETRVGGFALEVARGTLLLIFDLLSAQSLDSPTVSASIPKVPLLGGAHARGGTCRAPQGGTTFESWPRGSRRAWS